MPTIDSLIPERGAPDTAALHAHDPDALARYVLDVRNPWWRRRVCVQALAGRVPEARVLALLGRIQDDEETGEVRIALLDLLADRAELLPWLRHDARSEQSSYGMGDAILKARGLLGDRAAARELATLGFSPWWRRQQLAEAGLMGLVERYGAEAIVADLGEDRPEDRAFAVWMRYRGGGDVTPYLADPDQGVAYAAHELATDADRLRAHVDEASTVEAAVWAVLALHRITEDLENTRTLDEHLGRPRVEVHGLDEELRRAIVHEYGPGCERSSDPRWRLEALCTEPPARPDVTEQTARAFAVLAAAGVAPKPPVSCGEHERQGDGTYYVIECDGEDVLVSTLGRFVMSHDHDHTARLPLEEAGFRWIDGETADIEVTDLDVYYFGSRRFRDVDTLLFYWQD
ncbi:hypothetical protein ABTY59_16030 [Streptomyces sp. NPDC096079]|uniref:hypothetical protein n=1 Tax=Streptomyces sp. NPDC096079 TaxID=3155820 RepID=UPI003323A32C